MELKSDLNMYGDQHQGDTDLDMVTKVQLLIIYADTPLDHKQLVGTSTLKEYLRS